MTEPLTSRSWRRIGFWLVPMLSVLFLLPGLDRRVANREQELRVLVTSRDMAEGGSWLVPHFRGEPRLRKPPLMYWITATSFLAAGTTESLFAGRLPSAIAGFLLVGAIYFMGRVLIGRRRAMLASLVCLSSFIFLRQARVAETDITLSLFTALSTFAGYLALTTKRPDRWWLTSGVFAGLGFLIKGPAAVALPVITVVWFAATRPRKLDRLFRPGVLASIAAWLVLALPWYVAIFLASKGADDQISRELGATFVESHHPGPWFYYVYTLLHAMAPWSLLLPVAFLAALKHVRSQGRLRFVVLWFLTGLIALSIVPSKQIHYTTLLLAPCSLMTGWLLGFADVRRPVRRGAFARIYVRTLIVLTVIASAALPFALRWQLEQPLVPVLVFAFLAGVLALAAWAARSVVPRTFLLVTAFSAWCIFVFCWGYAGRDKHTVVADIAATARNHIGADTVVYSVGGQDGMLDFYLHHHVVGKPGLDPAWAAAAPGDLVILAARTDSKAAREAYPAPPLAHVQRTDFVCALFQKPPSGN